MSAERCVGFVRATNAQKGVGSQFQKMHTAFGTIVTAHRSYARGRRLGVQHLYVYCGCYLERATRGARGYIMRTWQLLLIVTVLVSFVLIIREAPVAAPVATHTYQRSQIVQRGLCGVQVLSFISA